MIEVIEMIKGFDDLLPMDVAVLDQLRAEVRDRDPYPLESPIGRG